MKQTEKTSYLKALMFMAMADDVITDEEVEYFSNIGLSFGFSPSDIISVKNELEANNETLDIILGGIESYATKIELLYNLLSLCYEDGEYTNDEKSGMWDICTLLGVEIERLSVLEQEIEEQNRLEKNPFAKLKNSEMLSNLSIGLKKATDASISGSKLLGEKIVKGSSTVAHSVSKGIGMVGSKISSNLELAKKAKEENKVLREKLNKDTLSEAVKQRVITQLHTKISNLNSQLKIEKQRNQRNEELIEILQAQIDDLTLTMNVAESIGA